MERDNHGPTEMRRCGKCCSQGRENSRRVRGNKASKLKGTGLEDKYPEPHLKKTRKYYDDPKQRGKATQECICRLNHDIKLYDLRPNLF